MIYSLLIIVGIVGLDQLTKWLVVSSIPLYTEVEFIDGFVCWTYTQNRGAAFGMLAENRWIFMVLSSVAICAMIFFLFGKMKRTVLMNIAVSFLVGGGIGNMVDRFFRFNEAGENFVVDFIKTQFVDFAVFNVADSFITIGAVIFCVDMAIYEIAEFRKRRQGVTGGDNDGDEPDIHGE